MKKIAFAAVAALTFAACSSDPAFRVDGSVSGAEGKMLYLEASTLDGVVMLDSLKLKETGEFSFKQPKPESPEFFRLRMDNKVINFSIDSTETIKIEAPYAAFDTDYTVSGSDNCTKIKELTLKLSALQTKVNELQNAFRANKIPYNVYGDSLNALVNNYKDDVKKNYIYAAPNTAAAYFALFQKLENYLLFDPLNNKDDVRCFAAVATSLNTFYPDALRSKNLSNISIKGMQNVRQKEVPTLEIPQDKIVETGIIEIEQRDVKGNLHKLSDLKGKVVLLDFIVFQNAMAAPHNLMLRELYDKYESKGLEIFQVSLDANEHFWKTSAVNLPWICVRDAEGVYSTTVSIYNVQQLPSLFLIDRNNELRYRGEEVKDLEATIKSLL